MKMVEATYPKVGRVIVVLPEWRDRLSFDRRRRSEHILYMVWGDDFNTDDCWEIPRLRWPQFNQLIDDLEVGDEEAAAQRLRAYSELVGKKVHVHVHGD